MQTPNPITINCPCGLRHENGATVVWLRSPRTGKTISFTERTQSGMPAGTRGRIVQSAARGQHSTDFSPDELRQLADLERVAREAMNPRRGGSAFKKNYGF